MSRYPDFLQHHYRNPHQLPSQHPFILSNRWPCGTFPTKLKNFPLWFKTELIHPRYHFGITEFLFHRNNFPSFLIPWTNSPEDVLPESVQWGQLNIILRKGRSKVSWHDSIFARLIFFVLNIQLHRARRLLTTPLEKLGHLWIFLRLRCWWYPPGFLSSKKLPRKIHKIFLFLCPGLRNPETHSHKRLFSHSSR